MTTSASKEEGEIGEHVHLNGCAVRLDIALDVEALARVAVRVKHLSVAGRRGRGGSAAVAAASSGRRPLLVRVVGDARPGLRAGAVGEGSVGQVETLGA